MKPTLIFRGATCILCLCACACGVPFTASVTLRDPDSGLSVTGGYSSKAGIDIVASK